MGGYAFVIGRCATCSRTFQFNPVSVPSIRLKGEREPVCFTCISVANETRKERGLEPLAVRPDAYEACREEDL